MAVESDAMRAFSAGVFNNRYALEVMAAVAHPREKPRFYVRELARELNLESNDVKPVIERLEAADLVARLPELGSHGAIYFTIVDEQDAFWEFVRRVFDSRRDKPG